MIDFYCWLCVARRTQPCLDFLNLFGDYLESFLHTNSYSRKIACKNK